jgi:FSR family fosmidomycin resistance protein-like MFS transporter
MNAESAAFSLRGEKSRAQAGMLALVLFSLGHFFVDLYSGSLGVMQPYLIHRFGLSLTQAGLLGGLLVFSSSVTQPLYGYLSDRWRSRYFSAPGPAVAGVFILGASLAPGYEWAVASMLIGGAGVSAFHPQASSWAALGMKRDRAKWMSVFISAGTLGIALAPAFFKEVITRAGFERIAWAALPGVAVTMMLVLLVREPADSASTPSRSFDWAALRSVWRPLSILYCGVFFRSAVQVAYSHFLVLYLSRERGYSIHAAAYTLTLYLTAGAIGGFLGGPLSDRLGARRLILLSFALSVPFLALFFLTTSVLGVISLVLGGLILLFTIPVNVVVAQQLVPSQAATVSALLMGFAWGAAGMIFIPAAGWLADRTSLHLALSALLVFPVLGWASARLLPEDLGR